MNNFLPDNYELPQAISRYTKFEPGETVKIRILPSGLNTSAFIFYEYFDVSGEKNKPVRSIKPFETTYGIREGEYPKEIWALKVWNYNLGCIQIMSISQKSIKQSIINLVKDNDFGNPLNYDLKITRTGDKLDTKYSIIPGIISDFTVPSGLDYNIDWAGFIEGNSDIFLEIKD